MPGPSGRLHADGTLVLHDDRAQDHVIRGLPEAFWNEAAGHWQVSVAFQDLAYVLSTMADLGVSVDRQLWAKDRPPELESAIERCSDAGLFPFQEAGVRWLSVRARALLADDMGLGKTVQAVMALPSGARAIVVCPAAARYVWRAELLRWRPDLEPVIRRPKDGWLWPSDGQVMICGYSGLPWWMAQQPRTRGAWFKKNMQEDGLGVHLICDEAHKVSNPKSARSKKLKQLARATSSCWMLTGTPMMDRQMDLWGVLSAGGMDGTVFGNWKIFLRLMGAKKGWHGGYSFGDPDPSVPYRLRRVMLRRTKTEVLPELPSRRYQDVVLDASSDVTGRMDGSWTRQSSWLRDDKLPPVTEMSSVRAAMAEAKIGMMLEMVSEYEAADTPLIVFSAHRSPVEALSGRDGWGVITGDVTPQDRKLIEGSFQAGRLVGVAATIAAGGEALTLTRASNMLFVDLDWTPAMNVQAEDRTIRIGQTAESVLIRRMIFDHPLDRHVLRVLETKMAVIRAAVDAN